jgi:uncharacterized membrane protein
MSRRDHFLAWMAILALAASLRFVALSRESYWLDELATLDVIGESWSRFAAVLARFDNHPPLYFALAKGWSSVFGRGEIALRSLSALLGTCSVLPAGALARIWTLQAPRASFEPGSQVDGSARADLAALAAGALVAVLPVSVRHAREARMYSLLELTSLLALLSLSHVLATPRRRTIVAAFIAHIAVLYTHVFGALLVAGEIAFVAAVVVVDRPPRPAARIALATLAASATIFAPWLPVLRARTATVGEHFWITAAGWKWPLDWGGGRTLGAAFIAAIGVSAGFAFVRTRSADRARIESVHALAITAFASLTAVPIALAAVYRPVFVPKYAIAAAAVAAVVAALGLTSSTRRRAFAATMLLAALGLSATIANVLRPRLNEDWRAVALVASRACRDHSATIAAARYAPMYRHYLAADCSVLDLEPFIRKRDETAVDDALHARLARTGDVLLLEVHPPRTDLRVTRLLETTHRAISSFDANEARAVRWVRRAP